MKENEVWLDSISGKISQFNNATQSMWSNFLDSDVVKGIVEIGTELVKIVDQLGLAKTLIITIGTYLTQKYFKGDLFAGLFGNIEVADNGIKKAFDKIRKSKKGISKTNVNTLETYGKKSKDLKVLKREKKTIKTKLSKITDENEAKRLNQQLQENKQKINDTKKALGELGPAAAKASNAINGPMHKLSVGFKKVGSGIKNVSKSLVSLGKHLFSSMATMYAITTILELGGKLWTSINEWGKDRIESPEEAQEKFEELNSELSRAQSEISDLESELDKTNDRMDELLSMGTLSFVEKEELRNLKEQSSELEHQIALAKTLEQTLQNVVNLAAINAAKNTFSQTSFYSEESKKDRAEEAKENGSTWGSAAGMALGLAVSLIPGVNIGAMALMGAGAFAGSLLGGSLGKASENSEYDSEKSVTEVLYNMAAERKKLEKTRDEAYAAYVKDPKNENLTKQWEEAQAALGTYDATLAQHISQMQQYINSIDPDSITNPADKAYYDQMKKWVDTYSVMMGGGDAKASVIESLFGENATDELKDIQYRIESAVKVGESMTFMDFEDDKYDNFKSILADYGITITEIIGYFKSLNAEESSAFDYDTYDTVKEISKLEDGFSSLKDAFDEFNESGAVTAQTLIKLNEVFGNVEGWQKYVDVMSTGTASTEEATKVTRDLAEALMHNVLLNPFDFTNDDGTKNLDAFTSYLTAVQQLRSIGVTNAKELVDAKQQEAMVNQVVANIKRVQELESKATLTEAEQTELTELKKNNYAEYAKVVEDAYGVQIKNTQLIEQQLELSKTQTELSKYNEFYSKHFGTSDLDLTAYEENAEKIGALQDVVDGYNATISEFENQGFWNTFGDHVGALFDSFWLNQDGSRIENDVTRYQDAVDQIGGYVSEIGEYKDKSKEIFDELVSFANENKISLDGININAFDATDVSDNSVFRQVYNVVEKYIGDKKIELEALEEDLKKQLGTSFDAIGLEVTLELLDKDKLIDDIQSVYDTLLNAQNEYAENGYLSVDTMQSLLQLEPKYLDMLVDENGNLNTNKSALQEVARARIIDLGLKQQSAIVDQALALAQQGSKEALDEWILVNEAADESMKDTISTTKQLILSTLTAREAAGELPEGYANNFMGILEDQLNAVQAVTDLALQDLDNSLSNAGNTAKAEADDAFQNLMDYYDNRISANQAKYDQIQNDIDWLESQGKIADADYYRDQIDLLTEGEESKEQLLTDKLNAAKTRLDELEAAGKKGSDEWWEAAKIYNDTLSELDDVRDAVLELQDAIGEIEWSKFEEFNSRLDDINSKLETMRDLIAPNGEEDWFDDEGNWTEKGVAVLGSYVQSLEYYKNGLNDANEALKNFGVTQNSDGTWSTKAYKGNEQWYADNYGVHSEQEYYDYLKKLTDEQYKYASSVSDTEQDIAGMWESQVDAVEEYMDSLVEAYSDYIDNVKEALDAERDLYNFKKRIQKQTKDIGTLERRIASLSGSANAADIAERRKLEAELYESRESLNDEYNEHSKQSQQDALDAESQAYEDAMTRFVENLRTNLDLALQDMDIFIEGVTSAVTVNAPTILGVYESLGVALDNAIVDPWQSAIDAMGEDGYSGEKGLGLMNSWVAEGGVFDTFYKEATNHLTSIWDATNVDPGGAFATAVGSVVSGIVTTIKTNVDEAKGYLQDLYDVKDNSGVYTGSGDGTGQNGGYEIELAPDPAVQNLQKVLNGVFVMNIPVTGFFDEATIAALKKIQGPQYLNIGATGKYDSETRDAILKYIDSKIKYIQNSPYGGYMGGGIKQYQEWKKMLPASYYYHAKGTTGATRDHWAVTDEPWLGDELVLVPGKDGNLSYMRKGTGVVPAQLTENLMEWGQFTPDSLNLGAGVNINMIHNAVIKPQYDFNFDSLVHVDHCDQSTLKDLEKMVDNKIDKFSRDLNYSIKKFSR